MVSGITVHPIEFTGAGPGDPGLLTLAALRALEQADIVLHDSLVAPAILALAGPQARLIDVGKRGFGRSTPQQDINRLLVEHANRGARVVRLKAGDPTIFARLDEELTACEAAGIPWNITPGITAAAAAAASLGQSQTQRGRNRSLRYLTGHDAEGLAEHDWAMLARPGAVAALYMGKTAARFVQGRLLMHGAGPEIPVSVIENASCLDERILATTLAALPETLAAARMDGPALIWLGLAPRAVRAEQKRKESA
ncbi:uroporphyrinogen-III C-methyltransferase [Pontibaca methylaminivorans]|uniref:uroporphyrinogen-III C-methyltransferase n=1 Tax=Pontibaca methylaminivorans TaxID=515897 RepID=A0A1R3WEA7_9RHOB|nr:uroporphyrinogen-III C-methyltransferase [Pontibaca methylaminivorans]SIT76275.1 uroporphyrin-III C-methyltransferase / precorrin-2 dehydrogenase / sirohydrochlorin ferrochelatase/uroporphyrin-III C-methyltransferase [Pontibaca methylaminivorans]